MSAARRPVLTGFKLSLNAGLAKRCNRVGAARESRTQAFPERILPGFQGGKGHPGRDSHKADDDRVGVAGVTGLEPAASGVTGRRSNRLSYTPARGVGRR